MNWEWRVLQVCTMLIVAACVRSILVATEYNDTAIMLSVIGAYTAGRIMQMLETRFTRVSA